MNLKEVDKSLERTQKRIYGSQSEAQIKIGILNDISDLRYGLLQEIYVGKKYKTNNLVFHIVNTKAFSFELIVKCYNRCWKEWLYIFIPYSSIDLKELY